MYGFMRQQNGTCTRKRLPVLNTFTVSEAGFVIVAAASAAQATKLSKDLVKVQKY
jgi:hypothetical protein